MCGVEKNNSPQVWRMSDRVGGLVEAGTGIGTVGVGSGTAAGSRAQGHSECSSCPGQGRLRRLCSSVSARV